MTMNCMEWAMTRPELKFIEMRNMMGRRRLQVRRPGEDLRKKRILEAKRRKYIDSGSYRKAIWKLSSDCFYVLRKMGLGHQQKTSKGQAVGI